MLSLAENHFRHAVPHGAMMIHFGEPEIFKRQVAQTVEGGRYAGRVVANLLEELLNLRNVHNCALLAARAASSKIVTSALYA